MCEISQEWLKSKFLLLIRKLFKTDKCAKLHFSDNFGFSTNSVYQQLVFDVDDENNVILGRKQRGNRRLLWRLTDNNLLQYEGKKPPAYPFENSRSDTFVLDVGT